MWRKQLIMPAEHGSWAWLLVPFAVGSFVARQGTLSIWLTLIAGLSIFLMRQPATVWLRVRRGKARRSDGPLAQQWLGLLGMVALLSGGGLLWLGRTALLWLLAPLLLIFVFYLGAARYGRSGLRSLGMELAGAAALAMMAPAAMIAASGETTTTTWLLWLIMAAQNMLGALYVRLRIFDTHQRPFNRQGVVLAHLLGLAVVLLLSLRQIIPMLVIIPFAAILLRAIWAARAPRPVPHVKQFGFVELAVEIVSGICIVAGYWLF
ncbi:MAG: YwiC-like family protein [Ardenticatenaceae bacterium]|nr:YwiC-like family protein [Ardenticatenaceae bacterium]